MRLPILVPSQNFRGAVGMTCMSLFQVSRLLKREISYIEGTYKGYVFAMNNLFAHAKQFLGASKIRGLIVEDDIYFCNPDKCAEAILKADEMNWNFLAPYKQPGGEWVVADDNGCYNNERFSNLKDWDVVPMGGLGFYYGDINLDYKFTENSKYQGHDLNFYYDNKIELRIVDLGLKHIKTVMV